jgi:phosphotransferase system enzyme I (PtsI)
MPARATGTVASIGYASGPLFLLDAGAAAYAPSGNPEVERVRLKDAIAGANEDIARLIAGIAGDGAAILEFQTAMLEDESLSDSAFAEIAAGRDAASAWTDALNEQVAGYDAADDPYFQARGADLRDIRDRVLRRLTGAADRHAPSGAVIHARDLTPTQFLSMDWGQGGGIVLREGSPASHVAMLARARGVPMIVNAGALAAANEDLVLVDAEQGRVTVLPDTEARHEFLTASSAFRQLLSVAHATLHEPGVTSDGARIETLVNIADPSETDHIDIATCDGVGLMRTEFLFQHGLADEASQYAACCRVIDWAAGKPVTIRTVDAGGDKPVPGFTVEETNPFLGLRGLRLALTRRDVFRTHLRALLRAAIAGNVKLMFPMVTVIAEYRAAVDFVREVSGELVAEGIPHSVPPLGIMVEVPAVAIDPWPFRDVAFFSIGSNDLTQYVMAAGRDNGAVAALNDPRHPAVLKLITEVTRFGIQNNIPVSLCGDAASDPAVIPSLIAAGLRTLSVAPAQLALARAAIARSSTVHGQS